MARHSLPAFLRRHLVEVTAAAAVAIVIVGTLLVVGAPDHDDPPPGSGAPTGRIDGRVVASPTCPVEGAPGCDSTPKPMRAAVRVVTVGPLRDSRSGEQLVTRVDTDSHGRFSVDLPAGDYQLRPSTTQPGLTSIPRTVHVASGRTTTVELVLDTGLR